MAQIQVIYLQWFENKNNLIFSRKRDVLKMCFLLKPVFIIHSVYSL